MASRSRLMFRSKLRFACTRCALTAGGFPPLVRLWGSHNWRRSLRSSVQYSRVADWCCYSLGACEGGCDMPSAKAHNFSGSFFGALPDKMRRDAKGAEASGTNYKMQIPA
jgi:hypothetical protein